MTGALHDVLRRASFEGRCWLAADPALYPLYRRTFVAWERHKIRQAGDIDPSEAVVTAATELVIDGYQGSANSFATVAFKQAQRRPVRLAHHLHSPAQIIRAVGLGVPAVVTVREPRGAALSLVRRWPHVSAARALAWYARFYGALAPVAGGLVVSPFEATIHHLGDVIEDVNARFGTAFDPFEPTPAHVAAVRGGGAKVAAKRAVAEAAKAAKAAEFERPEAVARLADARVAYRAFLLAAGLPPGPAG